MAETQKSRGFLFVFGALVLGLVAGAFTIYGMGGFSGNGENEIASSTSCKISQEARTALDASASGEVAAMQITDTPRELATLGFLNEEGEAITLADWKGKVVLLNIWATWCVPCREEMPDLANLQDQYAGEEFEVLALNVDRNGGEKPGNFLREINAEQLGLYLDPKNEAFQDLRSRGLVFGLPTTMIVDENGCVQGRMSGIARWWSDDGRNFVETAVRELKARS